jgi:hypothetical protein
VDEMQRNHHLNYMVVVVVVDEVQRNHHLNYMVVEVDLVKN